MHRPSIVPAPRLVASRTAEPVDPALVELLVDADKRARLAVELPRVLDVTARTVLVVGGSR